MTNICKRNSALVAAFMLLGAVVLLQVLMPETFESLQTEGYANVFSEFTPPTEDEREAIQTHDVRPQMRAATNTTRK